MTTVERFLDRLDDWILEAELAGHPVKAAARLILACLFWIVVGLVVIGIFGAVAVVAAAVTPFPPTAWAAIVGAAAAAFLVWTIR